MAEIKFRRDTAFRKQFFVPDSFAHPAKMDAQLLMWIVLKYTEAGEIILDPMAGSGTTMLACNVGRDVILVELEGKFCKMMRDNWELVRMKPQLGCQMGTCQIIQGDARQLENILCDKIITSPPYAEGLQGKPESKGWDKLAQDPKSNRYGRQSHPSVGQEYSDNPDNLGNLPYGDIDKIITSPPHGDSLTARRKGYTEVEGLEDTRQYPDNPQNIGNKPYGDIDSIITSPPYEGSINTQDDIEARATRIAKAHPGKRNRWSEPSFTEDGHSGRTWAQTYSPDSDNIGNLKSDTYLEAMLQVYQQCFKVLKDGGLLILVTKNFIRNKQVVRLDTDTIKLCEQAGFSYVERHWRKLPAQSFWRIIYQKKFPNVKKIEYEDVLVFRKKETNA